MKFSFSTLGCPGWTWQEILTTAKDLNYDGIELRGIAHEIYTPKSRIFNDENISSTIASVNRLGLSISCVTSAAFLFDIDNFNDAIREGKDYIDLAVKLGSPFVRVLGDKNPEPGDSIDDDIVRKGLNILSEYADGKGVTILIETNGVYADSSRLVNLMNSIDSNNAGVLWDIHHPYRFFNESVSDTYGKLKDYIKYIHVKDSVLKDGKIQYKMMGHGDVPVTDAINILKNNNYNGFVSLEWVKRWNMELEEPGVVFSNFINFVRRL